MIIFLLYIITPPFCHIKILQVGKSFRNVYGLHPTFALFYVANAEWEESIESIDERLFPNNIFHSRPGYETCCIYLQRWQAIVLRLYGTGQPLDQLTKHSLLRSLQILKPIINLQTYLTYMK